MMIPVLCVASFRSTKRGTGLLENAAALTGRLGPASAGERAATDAQIMNHGRGRRQRGSAHRQPRCVPRRRTLKSAGIPDRNVPRFLRCSRRGAYGKPRKLVDGRRCGWISERG